MKICICGWYYRPLFLAIMGLVHKYHKCFIVAHRNGHNWGLPSKTIENIGLEFGAYDYYLKNEWDHESDVMFMHDDTKIVDHKVFDEIAKIPHDQAFIFRDCAEELANGRVHGRAFFCSKRFLDYLLSKGGFWFDENNTGHIGGKVPEGMMHYNTAVHRFGGFAGRCNRTDGDWPGYACKKPVYFADLVCGRRNKWKHVEREIRAYGH